MAAVTELIRSEANGAISFGDYTLGAKSKLDNFEHAGDKYKVKTFGEITKLERNGMFAYESVPGTAVLDMLTTEEGMEFDVEGMEDAEITLGLTEATEYDITVGGNQVGQMKTNLGGKLTLSVELNPDTPVHVKVQKI
ncbi:MAG: endosialidase [Lachnospiraceae bacterium]|nr:endosialidase [Lachnospiraceae bacterium]MDE7435214.1 endosialidase [Lachnospiraceae bacterium]